MVQGEGRGHMSQALALSEILSLHGHVVCKTLAGKGNRNVPPGYFLEKIPSEVETYDAPFFVKKINGKGINIGISILYNLLFAFRYLKSIKKIYHAVKINKPDVVVGFYEPLLGLAYRKYEINIPLVCIGHHFMHCHPDFYMPPKMPISRRLLKFMNGIVTIGASKILVLSFYKTSDFTNTKFRISPPLIREAVLHGNSQNGDYLLGYMLNEGHVHDVLSWSRNNHRTKALFFVGLKKRTVEKKTKNIEFYELNDELFIEHLKNCKGFITTAGFESVCEAAFLNKKIVVVPTPGHFEQLSNAHDASLNGLAKISRTYEKGLNLLSDICSEKKNDNESFINWVKSAKQFYIEELTNF